MSQKLKVLLVVVGLIALGAVCWKMLSNPLPTPDYIAGESVVKSDSQRQPDNFPEYQVGSAKISPADFQWELDLHSKLPTFDNSAEQFILDGKDGPPTDSPVPEASPELRERIVTSLVERKLIYQYISQKIPQFDLNNPSRYTKCLDDVKTAIDASNGFFSTSKSREMLKTKICEQSIVSQYLSESVFNSIVITPSEISKYYKSHEARFKRPLQIVLRQIVFAFPNDAKEVRKIITPNNFEGLAKKYSIAPEGKEGGLVGPFSKEQLPTLFDMIFSLEIGEISGVIKSDYGYHIMMPVRRIAPRTLSESQATGEIKTELMRLKKLDAYQRLLNLALNAIAVTSPNTGIAQ